MIGPCPAVLDDGKRHGGCAADGQNPVDACDGFLQSVFRAWTKVSNRRQANGNRRCLTF